MSKLTFLQSIFKVLDVDVMSNMLSSRIISWDLAVVKFERESTESIRDELRSVDLFKALDSLEIGLLVMALVRAGVTGGVDGMEELDSKSLLPEKKNPINIRAITILVLQRI